MNSRVCSGLLLAKLQVPRFFVDRQDEPIMGCCE